MTEAAKEPVADATNRSLPSRESRILVVEDNRDILRATQRILASQSYGILTAMDGEEALRITSESLPDLVLLDVMIPKIDGLEVLRRLKADPKTSSIMVILVTGRASLDHRVEGFDAGADDYIPKPFQVPELLARVRCALRIKHLTDDLNERNQQLIKSQRALVRSEKMATIGLLASGIAHEFNNIMAGISGYAQLARRDDKYRDALVEVALTQTERALELTRSLSTYNRTAPQHADCDVAKTIQSVLCLVTKELERTNVQVVKELLETPHIDMSPGQFQEIILNLVLNAIQAIEGKSGCVRVRISPAQEADRTCIEVTDNGIGIPEENLDRVFDPFFTTKGALGGGTQSGTGLGLTVCYNIVSSHGGDIDVTSQVGKGTTFRITLPRAKSRPADSSSQADEPGIEAPQSRLRILVVDDEEPSREVIRECMPEHEVVLCSNGDEALEACKTRSFDFVILDVCIQGSMDGFQLFDRLWALVPRPRIIFASGRFPDEKFRGYLARAHGHLLKPFKLESLMKLLGLPARETVEVGA